MNVDQLITSLTVIIATVVGGLIVIVPNWVNKRTESKKTTQEWYDQTYIIEGIDPLITYYQRLSLSMFNKASGYTMSIAEEDIPIAAISKVRILLKAYSPLLNIILKSHWHLSHTEDVDMLQDVGMTLQHAVEAFLDYRRQLIAEIPKARGSKYFGFDTTELTTRLRHVENELNRLEKQRVREEAVDYVDADIPIGPPISRVRPPVPSRKPKNKKNKKKKQFLAPEPDVLPPPDVPYQRPIWANRP